MRLTAPVAAAFVIASLTPLAHAQQPDPFRDRQYALDRINLGSAHDVSTGEGVIVAVIDSGVSQHEDLQGKLLPGWDYVDNDPDPSDMRGHGTHVAGIIAANNNNGVGIASVAPGARILPLRVLDANGEGVEQHVADAIGRAVLTATRENAPLVINLSLVDADLSGRQGSPQIARAVDEAAANGAVVVAAAGNDALPFNDLGGRRSVIVVGALGAGDDIPSFSNSGVGIIAPGEGILSTFVDPQNPDDPTAYARTDGTSVAAPHVAGAAALLLAAGFDAQTTIGRILGSATDFAPPGYDERSGFGVLNVSFALGIGGEPTLASVPNLGGPTMEQSTGLMVLAGLFVIAASVAIGLGTRDPVTEPE